MKRTKNSRKMHMVFNVQSGTVEVKVHENEFTVHKGGIWQVPRGELHIISSLLSYFSPTRILYFLATVCQGISILDKSHDIGCSVRITMMRKTQTRQLAMSHPRGPGQAKRDNVFPYPADCGVPQYLHAQHAV
jgi:hypothetical protein